MSHQLSRCFYGTILQGIADFGRTYRHVVNLARFDFNHFVAKALTVPTQVIDVSLPAQAKAVIVPDDDTFRMEFFHQKLLNVLICTHLGELHSKGNHYQMIYMVTFKQMDLFLRGGDQAQRSVFGEYNRTGMGMKSDDDTFSLLL